MKGFLLCIAQGLVLAVIGWSVVLVFRNSIELVVCLVNSLGLLIDVGEDSLNDSIVCWFSASIEDQAKSRWTFLLDLEGSNFFF